MNPNCPSCGSHQFGLDAQPKAQGGNDGVCTHCGWKAPLDVAAVVEPPGRGVAVIAHGTIKGDQLGINLSIVLPERRGADARIAALEASLAAVTRARDDADAQVNELVKRVRSLEAENDLLSDRLSKIVDGVNALVDVVG